MPAPSMRLPCVLCTLRNSARSLHLPALSAPSALSVLTEAELGRGQRIVAVGEDDIWMTYFLRLD